MDSILSGEEPESGKRRSGFSLVGDGVRPLENELAACRRPSSQYLQRITAKDLRVFSLPVPCRYNGIIQSFDGQHQGGQVDNIVDDLVRAARRCERGATPFDKGPVHEMIGRLMEACQKVERAWSGSFIGYQAFVYTEGLRPMRPGEYFSIEWGPEDCRGSWGEYDFETVREEIERRADVKDTVIIQDASRAAHSAFDSAREEILPALDAIKASRNDTTLKDLRDQIAKLKTHHSMEDFINSWIPSGSKIIRDPRAMNGGLQAPHHMRYRGWLMERASYGYRAAELAKLTKQAVKYLKYTLSMKGNTVAKTDGKIFIGHGRSAAWRDLKDLLVDRLNLEIDEFNRESAAGIATKERLETMLDNAVFAFLVMTGEDEKADGSLHARANVIHEIGLFQGRHGFERAIILLEDGCSEFSNIVGLGEIRFPKGNILAKSEEIRQVLEREKIL